MAHGATYTNRALKDSSDVSLSVVAKTATFNTEDVRVGDWDYIGIGVKTESSSGTSPTLDVKMQVSWNGGTSYWDAYPDDANSETQAALAQITGNAEKIRVWPCWIRSIRDEESKTPVVRFVFTIGGTSPSFTITSRLIARKFSV